MRGRSDGAPPIFRFGANVKLALVEDFVHLGDIVRRPKETANVDINEAALGNCAEDA